jgi:drug/metabolite transporter (DMT)-like permease
MDPYVVIILLLAAGFHAGWNAIMKAVSLEPIAKTTLLNLAAALFGALLIPYFGLPSEAAYPYLFASVILNNLYLFSLMYAYRTGHMDQVYPLVRGTAVFLTAITSSVFFGEKLSLVGWVGICAVATGVLLLSMRGRREIGPINRRAVGYALLTAVFLSVGLIVDGSGARVSGNAYAYIALMFVLTGIGTLMVALIRRGPEVVLEMPREWKKGAAGGFMMFLVYGIGVWAMTVELIPKVVAVRDTSLLFGAAIAYFFLKEPLQPIRVIAAVTTLAGVVFIRLG